MVRGRGILRPTVSVYLFCPPRLTIKGLQVLARATPLLASREFLRFTSKCAREDLNLHASEGTATSRLRVCQFHHSRISSIFVNTYFTDSPTIANILFIFKYFLGKQTTFF